MTRNLSGMRTWQAEGLHMITRLLAWLLCYAQMIVPGAQDPLCLPTAASNSATRFLMPKYAQKEVLLRVSAQTRHKDSFGPTGA